MVTGDGGGDGDDGSNLMVMGMATVLVLMIILKIITMIAMIQMATCLLFWSKVFIYILFTFPSHRISWCYFVSLLVLLFTSSVHYPCCKRGGGGVNSSFPPLLTNLVTCQRGTITTLHENFIERRAEQRKDEGRKRGRDGTRGRERRKVGGRKEGEHILGVDYGNEGGWKKIVIWKEGNDGWRRGGKGGNNMSWWMELH